LISALDKFPKEYKLPDMLPNSQEISTSEVRGIFKRHGLSPKKWMGQNLLVDVGFLNRIVKASNTGPEDRILEIGAGLGVLTSALAETGAEVWALEMDRGFFRVLNERFQERPNVHLLFKDATKFDFHCLYEEIGRLKVVANLPYSVSSRILFYVVENRAIFESMTILLQKEVAQRLICEPGRKEYGALSVLTQASGYIESLFDIPPKAFYPRPKIDSTLVRITFPKTPPAPATDWPLMIRLVKAAFSSRRKKLLNNLSSRSSINVERAKIEKAAQIASIDLSRRGETLSPEEFSGLANGIEALEGK
jgi:16S rRNA (adenine1518-N6/adenine1519-N6)-dimethyltransferase